MNRVLLPVLAALLVFVGCEEDSVSPTQPASHQITIAGLPDSLVAPEGWSKSLPFELRVSSESGRSLEGVTVSLSASGGSVSPVTVVTDKFGVGSAELVVGMPANPGTLRLYAVSSDGSALEEIRLLPTSQPATVTVSADPSEVTVLPGASAEIELTALLLDADGKGVPGMELSVALLPAIPEGAVFGSLEAPLPTDKQGESRFLFRSRGGSGRLLVAVSYYDPEQGSDVEAATATLTVNLTTQLIASLQVSASETRLTVSPDEIGTAEITAQVKDARGLGIVKLQVEMTSNLGILSKPTLTDELGVSRATFNTNGEFGMATIEVTIPGTQFSSTVQIEVVDKTAGATLLLFTDKTVIYADGGVTYANLTAFLRTADGNPIAGESIRFISEWGAVTSPVRTDSSGRAFAVFTDIGLPSLDEEGNPVPAVIFAVYDPWQLEATVEVTILERNPVRAITLVAQTNQMLAGRGDSTEVTAFCIQQNGDIAPDGTEVLFRCLLGRFDTDRVFMTSGNGRARTNYIAPQRTGIDILTAWVFNPDGDSTGSNEWRITLIPGPPSSITVRAIPNQIQIGDPNAFSEITATVTDTAGNAVEEGTLVNFSATLGVIPMSATTDTEGKAVVRIMPVNKGGYAIITAWVNGPHGRIEGTTTVRFVPGNPNTLEFRALNPRLAPAGTGGLDNTTIEATVRDPNGNPIGSVVPVYFRLLDQPEPPRGCNINNRGHLDSAFTSNAVARVSLNAGTQSGAVLMKVYTWRDPLTRLDEISVTRSVALVEAGPPWLLDIDVNNDGVDAGGGSWEIEVSVRVYDFYRNPVADGIPVVFTVEPDVANIENGITGEPNRYGQTFPGIAFASMIYNSDNTFDTLMIIATVPTAEGERNGVEPYVLPLQRGQMQLNVSPTNHIFNDADTPCNIRCWAVLSDGHDVRVNNAPILFQSNRGKFYRRNFNNQYVPYNPPEPAVKYTGWRAPEHPDYEEDDGVATVFLRGTMDDFFLDPFTLEVSVWIQASVVGFEDVYARPAYVYMTRH